MATILAVAAGIPLSALFLWLAARNVDLEAVGAGLRDASPGWLALAVLALHGTVLPLALRWRTVCRPIVARRPSTLAHCEAIACAVAANNVLPGRPGEPLRVYWLSRAGGAPLSAGAASVVLDRSADFVVLVLVVAAGLPFVEHPAWLTALALSAAAVSVLLVAGVVACRWYAQRSPRGRAPAPPAARPRWRRVASSFVRTVAAGAEPRRMLLVLVPTCLTWLMWAAGAMACARALGLGLSPAEALVLGGIVNLGIGIPSSPGFVGTYHWLVVAALGLFAVDPSTAFAYAVALHGIWYLPATLAGLALMPRLGIGLRRLRAAGGPVLARRDAGPPQRASAPVAAGTGAGSGSGSRR